MLFSLVVFAPCPPGGSLDSIASSLLDSSPSMLICEFYPRGLCDDEYMTLFNAGTAACNLKNWSVTDGEGTVAIMRDCWVSPGMSISMSFNSTSYSAAFDHRPAIALDDETEPGAVVAGTFRLGDLGDEISLVAPSGLVVDAACYGRPGDTPQLWLGDPIPVPKQGEVLRRVRDGPGYHDTDRCSDWAPFREFRYGYTDMPGLQVEVEPGQLTAFTSPDSSLAVLMGCVRRAQQSIRLCAYEASSAELCVSIMEALSRGVIVQLLVDGAPAGGLSEDEILFLSVLTKSGADVRVLSGNASNDIIQHVYHLHAKYGVFDRLEVVVLSENFVESAFPTDQMRGNRGWGALVSNQKLADHLGRLFESDSRITRPDVRAWRLDHRFDEAAILPRPQEATQPARVIEPLRSSSPAKVSVHISPDCSDSEPFICGLLSKSKSLVGEQFQSDLVWSTRWSSDTCTSPLLAAITASVRNGSATRILFDSSWFNLERNTATCEYLRAETASVGEASEFRMMDQGGPVELLHNKGLVIDERLSVVSSNNWVFASFARNRELALIIDSSEVASFFLNAFSIDWLGDESPPVADAGEDVVVRLGDRVVLNGSSSRDDHAISSWSWDVYSDGNIDGSASRLEFHALEPGKHEAVLTVEDPWGNRDTDIMSFTVLPSYSTPARSFLEERIGWLLATACVFGSLAGVFIARKINHGASD